MISFNFDEEFYMRLRHNFKLYVLLSSRSFSYKQDDIVNNICKFAGYRCHKAVKFGLYTSHILVKFEEEWQSMEAIEYLNKMCFDLNAVLLDVMLRDWFTYEMRSGFGPPCTITIVDIVGQPPFALNFLTCNILNSILQDFGGPYVLPYTAAFDHPHLQVLFGSMTEALAASMAFGEWDEKTGKVDSFSYRVRINPSEKENLLIMHSGGRPLEAFKLDYFLCLRGEVGQSAKTVVSDNPKPSKHSHSKSLLKFKSEKKPHKQNNRSRLFSQGSMCNGISPSVLCVPVIAPLNSNDVANGQPGMNFPRILMEVQQCCSVSAEGIVASKEVSRVEIVQAIEGPINTNANNATDAAQTLVPVESLKSAECSGGEELNRLAPGASRPETSADSVAAAAQPDLVHAKPIPPLVTKRNSSHRRKNRGSSKSGNEK